MYTAEKDGYMWWGKKDKGKNVVLLSNITSEYLGRSVGKLFFNYFFSKKHPKLPNLVAFSIFFFIIKGEKTHN